MLNLLASFQIAYVADIVCALLLLIFAVGGAKKGFVRCFFGLISTLVALILAIAFASTVANLLPSIFGSEGFFAGKFEGMFLKVKGFDADISADGIAAALESVSLPSFLKNVISKNISEVNDLAPGTTLANVVAPVAAQFLGLLISGLVIFIVAKIILRIFEKILTRLVSAWSFAAALNRLLGFAAGLLKAAFIICSVVAVLSLVPSEGIVSFIDKTLVLKYIYHKNPLTMIMGMFIKF